MPFVKMFRTLVLPTLLMTTTGQAAELVPVEQPEEIVVGRQPGPPLWRVSNGDNALWIFPYLQVIPKDMVWESDRVARVIAESQEYIGMPRGEADTSPLLLLNPVNLFRGYRLLKRLQRNPDGSTLEGALSPDVYARFTALNGRYLPRDDEFDQLRPLFAAGRMTALVREEVGLVEDGDILETIRKHVRRNRDMKVTDVEVGLDLEDSFGELADRAEAMLDSLSREEEQACFEQRLRHLEEDLEHVKSCANAWALGYVDEFRNIPLIGGEGNACLQLIRGSPEREMVVESNARLDQMWLDAAQARWKQTAAPSPSSTSTPAARRRPAEQAAPTRLRNQGTVTGNRPAGTLNEGKTP